MKNTIILCVICMVVFVSGCIIPYDPYKYARNGTYSTPELALNFDYPSDWNIEKSYFFKKGTIKILKLKKDEDVIEVYILPRSFNVTLSDLAETLEAMENFEYFKIKQKATEEIGNRTWVKLLGEYHDYYEVVCLSTVCPNYDFIAFIHSESNDTEPLYQIAESLQCGEIPQK